MVATYISESIFSVLFTGMRSYEVLLRTGVQMVVELSLNITSNLHRENPFIYFYSHTDSILDGEDLSSATNSNLAGSESTSRTVTPTVESPPKSPVRIIITSEDDRSNPSSPRSEKKSENSIPKPEATPSKSITVQIRVSWRSSAPI